jgi:hypothetical protein
MFHCYFSNVFTIIEIEEGELREDVALDTPIRIDTKRYGSSLLESDSSDDEPSHKRRSSRFGSERRSPDSSHKKVLLFIQSTICDGNVFFIQLLC